MNNIHTANEAYINAIKAAGLENNDPRCISILLQGGIYEICVRTVFQRYDFYVGAVSGEVLGMNAEPVVNLDEVRGYSSITVAAA